MKKRIVITGVGVLAPNGEGRENYWKAISQGNIGYGSITLFDSSHFPVKIAAEVSEFNAKHYLGIKGLRSMDRSTRLSVSAAKLALDDAKININQKNSHDIGVSVGTTLGSVRSINEFDEVTLKEGPRFTNPALFPNTVINSPASQVSIWHDIRGFNTTISSGFTASLDAIQYGFDFLQSQRAQIVLAGGVEEMCLQTYFGFYALKLLSGAKGNSSFINCPFDKRRNGVTLGEGACFLALENYDHAKARKANILGEVLAFGYSFDPKPFNKVNPKGTAIVLAIKEALNVAGLMAHDIDFICANANSTVAMDRVEARAIKEVFGRHSKKVLVSAIKSMVGECYSVSGALGLAACLGSLVQGFIPPTVNYKNPDPECALNIVAETTRDVRLKNILLINFGPTGNCGCVVLRKV